MSRNVFIQRFLHHRIAVVALCVVVLEVLVVCLAPLLFDLDPITIDATAFSAAPSEAHPLGTDTCGRDLLARLIYGGRTTLLIGVSATAVSVLAGLPLGLFAGFYRGWVEALVMRASDICQSFPATVLGLVIAAVFGSGIPMLIIVIGLLNWPFIAKLIYGNVLSVRSREFVEADRAIGVNDFKLMFNTILPNSIAPMLVSLAFRISSAMLTESSLSFLGAGVQAPQASWGNIIQEASSLAVLTTRWWIWIPAGVCLLFTVISLNFVGEGLRDALDPKMQRV